MSTINEIRKELGKHRDYLFQAYPIKSIAIFGSYARKENTGDSDLDILVEFNDKIGIRFIDLADEKTVDAVVRNRIVHEYFGIDYRILVNQSAMIFRFLK